VNRSNYFEMQDFGLPSLTNAPSTEHALLVGSDANRFAAESTLPLYSNLQPSWLSAGALSLGYRSLSGPLQGVPAVRSLNKRKGGIAVICHQFPRIACFGCHCFSFVLEPKIMQP
jgi:hypothetical protein